MDYRSIKLAAQHPHSAIRLSDTIQHFCRMKCERTRSRDERREEAAGRWDAQAGGYAGARGDVMLQRLYGDALGLPAFLRYGGSRRIYTGCGMTVKGREPIGLGIPSHGSNVGTSHIPEFDLSVKARGKEL